MLRLEFNRYFHRCSLIRQLNTIEEFFDFLSRQGEFTKKIVKEVTRGGHRRAEEIQVPYKIHPKQVAWWSLWTQKEEKVSLFLASRWKGKTDIVTILYSAWYIYNNRYAKIGIVTKTLNRANTLCKKVTRLLRYVGINLTKDEFGNFWFEGENLGSTPTLARTYIGQPIRGNRFDVIVFDDALEDKDEYYPLQIRKVDKHFNESISLTDKLIVVGQLITKHDLHYRLRNSQDVYKIESWQGDIPEIERPIEQFKNLNEKDLARNYLGYIDDTEDAIFLPVQIDQRTMNRDALFGVLDPSKEGHDYTALAIGWITDGVLTIWGKLWKASWGECEDDIVEIGKNLKLMWVETNIVGSSLTNILVKRGVIAESFASTKNKTEKIMGLRGLIKSGRIMFYRGLGELEKAQLYNWTPAAEHDDLPDAVAMLADFMGVLMIK